MMMTMKMTKKKAEWVAKMMTMMRRRGMTMTMMTVIWVYISLIIFKFLFLEGVDMEDSDEIEDAPP